MTERHSCDIDSESYSSHPQKIHVNENPLNYEDKIYKEYAGQSVEITVQPLGTRRNSKQNRFYWKVIVGELSKDFGYTKGEMHKALKLKFDINSTAKLSVSEFRDYIESIIHWASSEYNFDFSTILEQSEH